jgi:4-amino-4-deoxy-L-arabinose transferase-like glycosyltransferase
MRRGVVILMGAAVALRWLFCFVVFPHLLAGHSTVGTQYYFDSYREIAASLLQECGYRLACNGPVALHRPPGYVLFMLATNPTDPSHCHLFVQLLNGLLGGVAVWLTFRAAQAWRVGSRGALFAAGIVAFWPFLIWETKVTVPENVMVVLIPAAFLLLARTRASHSAALALALGAAAGATALTHASYQVLVVGVVAALLWPNFEGSPPRRDGSTAHRARAAVLVVIAFLAVVSPWVARNRRIGFTGIATGFGYHYWKGVYDFDLLLHHGTYFRDNDIPATEFVDRILRDRGFEGIDTNPERSNLEVNRFLDHSAALHMRSHVGYTVAKTLVKMPLAWVQQQTPKRAAVTAVLLLPLFFLAVRGVARRHDLFPIVIPLLVLNAAFASVFVEAIPMRYALPLLPLVAILAGAGVGVPGGGEQAAGPNGAT